MAVSSGIYGLAGVVIGGIVTGGVQWGIAARADWLDTRIARRRVKAELATMRTAVGYITHTSAADDALVGDDLLLLYYDRLKVVGDDLKHADMLKEYGDRLARHLSDDAWDVLNNGYDSARRLAMIIRPESLPNTLRETSNALDIAISQLA